MRLFILMLLVPAQCLALDSVAVWVENGQVNVTEPTEKDSLGNSNRLPGETDAAFISRIMAKDVPGKSYTIVAKASIPRNRRWRDAWVLNGGVVQIGLERARRCKKIEILYDRAWILRNKALMSNLKRNRWVYLDDAQFAPSLNFSTYTLRNLEDLEEGEPNR